MFTVSETYMSQYEREIELYDYIEVLLKYKWFILAATLLCGGAGWHFRPVPAPPIYKADVVLMAKNLSPQPSGATQADLPTGAQTSGFFSALALADDLKQALIDSLGLSIPLTAMDGLLHVEVLDPGIRLSVSSHDQNLPIRLVNEWAKLFVERNRDVNVEEVGSYYDYVKGQYDVARSRLHSAENRIIAFETENSIDYLELQRTVLDSAVVATFKQRVSIEGTLQENKLKLQEINFDLSSIDSMLYKELTPDDLLSHNRRNSVTQVQLKGHLRRSLQLFDSRYDTETIKRRLRGTALDSLRQIISNLEREIESHTPMLNSVSNGIHSTEPNPTYVMLSDRLSALRPEYKFAINNITQVDAGNDSTIDFAGALDILQDRQDIINRHHILEQLNLLSRKQEFYDKQVSTLRTSLDSMKKGLSTKIQDQQRLFRDRDLSSETVSHFSKILEETRIVREKTGGDMRVLTRALKVRQIPQAQGQQKATIAAGIGLLISTILSLLFAYVRKAKLNRAAEAKQ